MLHLAVLHKFVQNLEFGENPGLFSLKGVHQICQEINQEYY